MSKFHINKHGVPAPCRATKGNCPLGGDSGNENHYNTEKEAQAGADKINESKHSILPGVRDIDKEEQYSYNKESLESMKDKQIAVEYDGKSFSGEVIGTHYAGDDNDMNGIIIQDGDGNVKHIKSHRLTKVNLEGQDEQESTSASDTSGNTSNERQAPAPLSDKEVSETGKRLTGLIADRKGSVKAPELNKNSTLSIGDVDTMIELRGEFITSQEHNPVKNVRSMFDHVANKSGKLYRYNDSDNPYLETHGYDFDRQVSNHRQHLERDGTFEAYDEDDHFKKEHGKTTREAFNEDAVKHRKLHDYSQKLAIEYGKDFEKKVATSGKYSIEDQDRIQGEYREALADRVGAHISNYKEEGSEDEENWDLKD